MCSQTLWNIFHQFVLQADENSDLVILTQISLCFATLFIPEATLSTNRLVLYLFVIHFLTELLLAFSGLPILKLLCSFLSCGAKFQILGIYFGWFIETSKQEHTELEWGLGPSGYLEWLTPLKKKQARRVDGFILSKTQEARADEWGRWSIGPSGEINWSSSRRMDSPEILLKKWKDRGSLANTEIHELSNTIERDGVDSTRREGVGLSDWRRVWDTRPLGHLEWLTKKYDDIRDDKVKSGGGSGRFQEKPRKSLHDHSIFSTDESIKLMMQGSIRKTLDLPASAERMRFPWNGLITGTVSLT